MNNSYFAALIFYIHYNPQKHGFVDDFRNWPWSSYHALVGHCPTKLKRGEILSMFGGIKGFEDFHRGMVDEKEAVKFIDNEFELEEDFTGFGNP